MRKIILFIIMAIYCSTSMAQHEQFLVFDFMKVADNQDANYWETETFWEKIHAERLKSGQIKGWDLWSLKQDKDEKTYQYVTVTIYNNAVSAMDQGQIMEAAQRAYPLISDVDLDSIIQEGLKFREISKRMFLTRIAATKDDFKMDLGTVMRMNFMDALPGEYNAYEQVEKELFLPIHQQNIDDGKIGHWAFTRVLLPAGSKVKTSHITFDMFKNLKQYSKFYKSDNKKKLDAATAAKVEEAFKTRDLNWTYVGTLVKTVKYQDLAEDK